LKDGLPKGRILPFATFQFSSGATDGETIMNEANLLESLGQVSASETGQVFRDFLRGHVREMICEVMAAEVTQLCGPKHDPSPSDHYRAGSSSGRVLYEGEREDVIRPRVRQKSGEGSSREVELATYRVAKDPQQLQAQIVQAIVSGVSARGIEEIKPNSPGVKKSSVSRLWQEAGSKFVDQLRGKDLHCVTWCALMLDGIRLSKDQTAVVALGIDSEGRKHVLDFALGSSESLEVSRELISRIVRRGFTCEHRLYAVLDGSDALRGAVVEFFSDAVVQRCLVHKERNIKGKLSKRHWGEVSRLFTRLRSVQGIAAAEEVFGDLKSFLEPINAEAYRSLHEAGDDLLALHRLNVPNTLHRSLLSTNAIENSFLNTRRKLGRVTRFRAETDQASRWLSYALLEAEKGFRRISGQFSQARPSRVSTIYGTSPKTGQCHR
jgi:transposase-like protein